MKNHKTFSPGRVVISGEHSVVYGYPAIVASINLGVALEVIPGKLNGLSENPYFMTYLKTFGQELGLNFDDLNFKIMSDLPIRSGLSSSTALAASLAKALSHHFNFQLSSRDLFDLLVKAESNFYPVSGMDQLSVSHEGLLKFQKHIDGFEYEELDSNILDQEKFFLINTGEAEEDTGEMVNKIKCRMQNPGCRILIKKIGDVSTLMIKDLKNDVFNHELIKENQRLLEDLGVVGDRAKFMVRIIENNGGMAKISGAGGVKSGSGCLLVHHNDSERLAYICRQNDWMFHPLQFDK